MRGEQKTGWRKGEREDTWRGRGHREGGRDGGQKWRPTTSLHPVPPPPPRPRATLFLVLVTGHRQGCQPLLIAGPNHQLPGGIS